MSDMPTMPERTDGPADGWPQPVGGLTLLGIANVLMRHWVLILSITILVTAVFVVSAFLSRSFRATSTFMPQGGDRAASPIAGLAAQFGVNIGGGSASESLNFYAELPTSRDILRELARTPVTLPETGRSAPLSEYLGIVGGDETARMSRTVTKLESLVEASADPKAGTVLVETVAGDPEIAEAMNTRILELVNDFNLRRRQSGAANERQFVEARMREAQRQLADAEATLQQFLASNRTLGDSPRLVGERMRRERRVQFEQEVYLSLAKAYEEARINEVRDTPVLTVIETPAGAARPAGTGRITAAVMGIVIGALLGIMLAFLVDAMRWQRTTDPDEYAEFLSLRQRMFRRFGRKGSGGPRKGVAG